MRCVLALSSMIGSGKSTLARALAEHFATPMVSFGDHVRHVAQIRGISNSRADLQKVGESLIEAGPKAFAETVLQKVDWRCGAIVDGIRHEAIMKAVRAIVAPLPAFLIFISSDETQRQERLAARGMNPADIELADAHSTEAETKGRLEALADLRVRGDCDTGETVRKIAEWVDQI